MINYLQELADLNIQHKFEGDPDNVKVLCPFHTDTNPSMGVNIRNGVYHCFVCSESGQFPGFLAAYLRKSVEDVNTYLKSKYRLSEESAIALNPSVIEEWHANIWTATPLLQELYVRTITDHTIRRYRLGHCKKGYGRGRITIPIMNQEGEWVNVRYYLPNAETAKMKSMQNRNKPRLYPVDQLSYDEVSIVGGEVKALAALQVLNLHGQGAISPCFAGEGKWHDSLTSLLSGKKINIIMDIDEAGQQAATKLARYLYAATEQVKIVKLLFPTDSNFPKGGADDFISVGGDLLQAIADTEIWKPPSAQQIDDSTEPEPMSFGDVFDPDNVAKRVEFSTTISAIGDTPYFLPAEFEIHCSKDAGDCCVLCPVFAHKKSEPFSVKVSTESPQYLKMADSSIRIQQLALSTEAGVPADCTKHLPKVTKHIKASEAYISPIQELEVVEYNTKSHQPCLVTAGDVQANSTYKIIGRMFPHPDTQRATFIASVAEPTGDDISKWSLPSYDQLKVFQPRDWNIESIEEKLTSIYDFLACGVTRTYSRQIAHLIVDLAYHSPLFIPFFGEIEKGWVEALILGDSSQGKTQIVSRLSKFYNLGVKTDCKNATIAGLLGGLIPVGNNKRLFVQWGAFVKADKKLLILEEVKGTRVEELAKLTEARSSGIVQLVKVETKTERCRTRSIWLSNARSNRSLTTYSYGIDAIKELIGSPEDMRRFDVCLCLKSLTDYDARPREPKMEYPREAFRNAVLFAWTRSADQIIFESEEYILQRANELTDRYVEHGLPILDKGWTKLKVARLAASLAIRTFSVVDGDSIYVRNSHVDYIVRMLDSVYSHPSCGYLEYSRVVKRTMEVARPEEILHAVKQFLYPSTVVEGLLSTSFVEAADIQDWGGAAYEQAQEFLSLLVRNRALTRKSGTGRRSAYVKTTGFVNYLRTLDCTQFVDTASPEM